MKFPTSTYRVQLHKEFTFAHLKSILPYLRRLGISAIYVSPITKARAGSMHGYDVIDPTAINPEIGTWEELQDIAQYLKENNMMWIQDIVPNHMAFHESNWRLYDVLQRGTASPYYTFFDINWAGIEDNQQEKILIPVLGDDLEIIIQNKDVGVQWADKGIEIGYADGHYPASINTYQRIANNCGEEIQFLIQSLISTSQQSYDEWSVALQKIIQQINANAGLREQIQSCIQSINDDAVTLMSIISEQQYNLAKWDRSNTEMNYRRFFAVNELISLQMERQQVFDEYHALISKLYSEGLIQGVRVDHIDGLYNPREYVERLRALLSDDCYIIVEKILAYDEDMGGNWNMQGTSGYEFLAAANQLFTHKEGADKLKEFYHSNINAISFDEVAFQKKMMFLENYMSGEWNSLVLLLKQSGILKGQAFTIEALKQALGLFLASFSVYRLYPETFPLDEESMRVVNLALNTALLRAPDYDNELNILKTIFEQHNDGVDDKRLHFIRRIMQFTGPLAAKGVEDTSFYVYNPLISHNEVGDSPVRLGITTEEFHEKMLVRQANNPYSLNATTTHDTKRGEDARIRINVLSELADEWIQQVDDWRMINTPFSAKLDGQEAPSFNEEYFIYQSLIGSFPTSLDINDGFKQRTKEFVLKALHEAKEHTKHELPNGTYEEACMHFVTSILENKVFLQSFIPFLQKVLKVAKTYSIAQAVLKITAPGIPDIYQGDALWDNSYVDPDNRRNVDYKMREQLLAVVNGRQAQPGFFPWLEEQSDTGVQKLFAIQQALLYRNHNPELFLKGEYIPVVIQNGKTDAIAYARMYENKWVLTIAPLNIIHHSQQNENLSFYWEKLWAELPEDAPTHWYNIFTGAEITAIHSVLNLGEVFATFPVAVLEGI